MANKETIPISFKIAEGNEGLKKLRCGFPAWHHGRDCKSCNGNGRTLLEMY
jgi:hypothetical protein